VRDSKLLCPEADQREEFELRRLDRQISRVFSELSLGIRLRHRQGIMDNLIARAMKSYIDLADTVVLPVAAYFHRDPVEELFRINRGPFYIVVDHSRSSELRAERDAADAACKERLEELRKRLVAQGQTYEVQFRLEQEAYPEALILLIVRFQKLLERGCAGPSELMDVQGVGFYLALWEEYGGSPLGLPGMLQFFNSDYFRNLPTSRIASQLWADILTDKQRSVKPGDSMDVQLLSVAIPICHFVLTDKDMKNRIERRDIHLEWNTKVFSLNTIDELTAELSALGEE
jgi:hypothetical protein